MMKQSVLAVLAGLATKSQKALLVTYLICGMGVESVFSVGDVWKSGKSELRAAELENQDPKSSKTMKPARTKLSSA